MEQAHGIGVLATIEEGEPRLRPMEFSFVDGELWAATSKRSRKFSGVRDGEHVEVLFMNEEFDHTRIRGILSWSFSSEDRARIWELQRHDIGHWYQSADDPDLVVLKVIPEHAETKPAHSNDRYREEKAA